ncbi:MAG: carboxypeptidase [Armatimonadetes bacterium]|nr:carboxypeptidase [Armatimonadota bacterium]
MPEITFDRYWRYEELAGILNGLAEDYPGLMKLESIGKSHEGRDIWLATVTNLETGPAEEKPAFWVDANIHATEVSASSAATYLIRFLLGGYGSDPEVTRSLDTRAYYIVPRLNPDGAELALADKPRYLRSSTRPYPYDEDPIEGLIQEDMDGDGRILNIRIQDSNGSWKEHPDDPRLLVRRAPEETGGRYFRLMPEGRLENWDGTLIRMASRKERLDLNRNFPAHWRQEHEQPGAGPYPTSEPEIRTIVDFIVSHPNITGGVTFHTYSGVLLRPYGTQADEAFPAEDLWTYQKIGEKGKEITGYPAVSVYHDFRYHPKEVITGVFDDWMYDHLGIFAWTTELWSPQRQAGIGEYKFIDWYREHPVEDDFKLLKWNDEVLEGKGYVPWRPFEHPQLGPVEIGGWDSSYAFRNPPPRFLEKEISPHARWILWQSLISPHMELYSTEVKPLGNDRWLIRAVVHNTGWLPSYVTKKALERKAVRGVVAEIALPEGAALETGKAREELGQLEGRAYKEAASFGWTADPTEDRLKAEWVVLAPQGSQIALTFRHERAGMVRTTVGL